MTDALHVIIGMEQRIDELGSELHESRKILFEHVVNIIIFIRCYLKVLLELRTPIRKMVTWRLVDEP